jgi:hypothetical protein
LANVTDIGQRSGALLAAPKSEQRAALFGVALALGSAAFAVWMWGFTIDDAFISIRYARHVAAGVGYRFNADGPATDGVTPLVWPFVLAPFARASAQTVLFRAKCINLVAWILAAFFLGKRIGSIDTKLVWKIVALVVVAIDLPVFAGAVSGMETGVATALVTFAALEADRDNLYSACILGGISALFRPELAAWAVTLALVLSIGSRAPKKIVLACALSIAPFFIVVAIRLAAFGRAGPLSLLAKPSDFEHGASYAVAAALASLTPLLAFAPRGIFRSTSSTRAIAAAAVVHLLAIASVGGDWMPYARLAAPIAPSLALVFIRSVFASNRIGLFFRSIVTFAFGVRMLFVAAPAGRHVEDDRDQLIEASRQYLQNAHVIASADIGWPTAATEAHVVDLAGLTDPNIAVLGGGHTSKRIDPAMIVDAKPDVVLLFATSGIDGSSLANWHSAEYQKLIDVRLADSRLFSRHFDAIAFLPLSHRGDGYVVLAPK